MIIKAFFKEAMIWNSFGHPNVLELLGVHEDASPRPRYALVSPWMEHGSLCSYLKKNENPDRLQLVR